jgi:HK97 family phage major capsid protein
MLKQLKLRKDLAVKKSQLESLRQQQTGFKTRETELATALEEAKTDEDINLVNEGIETLEKEVKEANADEKAATIENEIADIEKELSEIDERSEETKKENPKKERGEKGMNKLQVRELLKTGAYYERAEVKEFYDKFKNLRAVTGGELTIPEIVVNRIMDILGDYSTLYPLVDKIRVSGTTRILIDTDTTAATWVEMKAPIPTGDVGTITDISFDGYKIGKVTFVDNSMLQDSIINLDDYVTKKIARAIALGLDLAILKGTGVTNKQPDGIIPKLAANHKVTANTGKLVDIVKPISLIDTGADSIGEIVAVMKRATYYNRFLGYTINVNSAGQVVGKLPNLTQPDLLGLRVVFNNNMDSDTVLYGDFSQYTLVERESVTIDTSEHVKFVEDQMAFRGKGRFDGKPTKPDAFVLVTIVDPVG